MATIAKLARERRAPERHASQYKPRMSAVEIVETSAGWSFRLNDRATHLELALLRLAYSCELVGEDSLGMVLRPRAGQPMPTREEVAAQLAAIHERRRPNAR